MNQVNLKLEFNSENLKILAEALSSTGKSFRLIGGCVRDKILNAQITDIDIATPLLPAEVIEACSKCSIKTVPTGIEYGTVTAIVNGEKFEITTLRKDIECFGRRVKVEYTEDYAQDAARRDFTINALSYDISEQKIYDYFGGLEDLKNSKVVFIGDAAERIKEDYLRILRFFRFSGRYAKEIDETGYHAAIEHKSGLKQLSRERITVEMDRILAHHNHIMVLDLMEKGGVFKEIDERISVNIQALKDLKELTQILNIQDSLATKYALLLSQTTKESLKDIVLNLRMSNKIINEIVELSKEYNPLREDLYHLWFNNPNLFQQRLLVLSSLKSLATDEAQSILNKMKTHEPKEFPINGNMLLALNFEGSELKNMLDKLKIKWVESNFVLTKDELLRLAQNNNS
ncbi:MAG: poly(A) polymerase [Rickettsiaceae bacterium]|jgi:poly(A) polymerase|nr:poly(A) polymerase [Rickettsiaceae bacterium]